jgi:hypothetical protein
MKSKATTVKAYLASLPADRRAGIEAVRTAIRRNLDKHYEESMLYGMIGYAVPHRVWPLGYHWAWFQKAWAKTGKKLDMGGCCIRFTKVEDAALDLIGEAIRRTPAKAYVERYAQTLASTGRGPDGKKLKPADAAKKTASKPTKKPSKKSAKKTTAKAAKKSSK